jgi:acetyl-CoA acyltransferase
MRTEARQIQLGEAQIVVAGGVESMTWAPWSVPKPSDASASGKLESYDTSLGWRYPNTKLGETAANVAGKFNISREDQDAFAVSSHAKAIWLKHMAPFKMKLCPLKS